MEYSENVKNYFNMCCVKSQLIMQPLAVFDKDYVQDEESTKDFISGLSKLLKTECQFLTLEKDIPEKASNILSLRTFKTKSKDENAKLNEMKLEVNVLNGYNERELSLLREDYIKSQEEKRGIKFKDYEDMEACLYFDSLILYALELGDATEADDTYFVGATNCFLKDIPEIYNDETVRDATIKKLTEISKRKILPKSKSLVNKTLINVKKISK